MKYLRLENGYISTNSPHNLYVAKCENSTWHTYNDKYRDKYVIRVSVLEGHESNFNEMLYRVYETREQAETALDILIANLESSC